MSLRTLLSTAALLLVACLPERGKAPEGRPGAAASPASPATTAPAVVRRPPPPPGSSLCEQVALTLPSDTVVARVDGQDVKIADLGDQLAQAEARALRTYCTEVARVREMALDSIIQQKVVTAAAEKAGKAVNEFVQERIDRDVPQTPSDEDIAKFYDERKSAEAPPLDLVRDQVIAALNQERSEKAFSGFLGELRAAAKIERMMPDVRPPALELDAPHSPRLGDPEPLVKVVEFSDFECPYCSRAADTMRALKDKYAGQKVQFIYRHFPLSFHPNARPAAETSQCAAEQDKFWPVHDAIFAAQRELSQDKLRELATAAGVDAAKLDECLSSGRAARLVEADMAKAGEAGVGGTPSFFINGQSFEGNPTPQGLGEAIDAELARLQG